MILVLLDLLTRFAKVESLDSKVLNLILHCTEGLNCLEAFVAGGVVHSNLDLIDFWMVFLEHSEGGSDDANSGFSRLNRLIS